MKKTMSNPTIRLFTNRSRLLALTCALLLLLSLAGCKSNSDVVTKEENSTPVEQSEETTTTSTNTATSTTTTKAATQSSVKKPTTTQKASTATKVAHNHAYTTKVVSPTCTKGGYTLYSCSCGHFYKRRVTDKMGHSYGDWVIKKQATVSANGSKERKCSRCGYVQKQSIPKKQQQSAGGIDPRVTIGTIGFGNNKSPQYSVGKQYVVDRRSWGSRPAIEVYDGNCLRVSYFNKKNEKVTFVVEPMGNYINQYTILNDGTYVSQLFGAYT